MFAAAASLMLLLLPAVALASTAVASRPADFKANCNLVEGGGCECVVGEGSTLRYSTLDLCRMTVELQTADNKAKLNAEIAQRYGAFKDNCFPRPSGGCKCNEKDGTEEVVRQYNADADCKKSVVEQTAEAKKEVNAEIKEKFGDFKDNCFPRPSGGCKCNEKDGTEEVVRQYNADAECRKSVVEQTAEAKKEVNAEIKEKFGSFKDNCFPKPSGGCKCNEKDAQGNEIVSAYNDVAQCVVTAASSVSASVSRGKRAAAMTTTRSPYDVRDPVREKAQANYAAVLDELRNKFKGLKEGCFPRPKGCLCIVGKTPEGRDVTERRMKDVDCKCQAGERGPGCPAA